jgi:hypothetical protein
MRNCPRSIRCLQPEGLGESSRWSKRSVDHREPLVELHPERGATDFLAPILGACHFLPLSGGLRYAATTGYFLAAFQAAVSLRPIV